MGEKNSKKDPFGMKRVFICFIGILSWACFSTIESETVVWSAANMMDKTHEDFDLSTFVRNWDFSILEQNDSCQLSKVGRIKIMGDDVFIVNIDGIQSDIYRFTSSGQFKNQIGKQGNGYDFVTNILIDSVNRRVCLQDIFERSIHFYDYEGNYLRSYKPYPHLHDMADVFYVNDNEVLGYYGITQKQNLAFFVADSLLLLSDSLSFYSIVSDSPGVLNFSKNAVSHYGKRTLLIHPFCDTIFEYRNRRLYPAFITQIGASLPEKYGLENKDCIWVKNDLERQGYYSKSSIFETGSHIWIGCGKNRLMFNKETNSGVYFKDSLHYHADVFPPLNFIGRKGEWLVTFVRGEEILRVKTSMSQLGIVPKGRLKALFECVDSEQYVLCFYTF